MFVQVKRNETWEEGNWSNFELFSSLELIVLEWRIDQMAGTTLTRKNYIKVQNQSSQKWLTWPIKQRNQTIVMILVKKIEFFSFSVLGQKWSWKNVWGSFR